MAIIKLNRRLYVSPMHGRGIHGRYSRVTLHHGGYGIVDEMGKQASKYVLGGIGKSTGSYAGKALGRLIHEKTGNDLLGKIAKAGLSSLGGLAGEKLGHLGSSFLGNTVFNEKDKKKKKGEEEKPKVALSSLLAAARNKVMPGHGINLIGT